MKRTANGGIRIRPEFAPDVKWEATVRQISQRDWYATILEWLTILLLGVIIGIYVAQEAAWLIEGVQQGY